MNSRYTIFFIATFITIHFVCCSIEDLEDLEVSRTVEPKVLSRLESQFLKMLGMEKRPQKRKSSIKIPRYLVELYKSQTGLDLPTSNLHLPGRHTRTANTVRSFYPSSKKLHFELNSIPSEEIVTGSEIKIPLNRTLIFSDHLSRCNNNNNNPNSISSEISSLSSCKVRVIINDVVKIRNKLPIMYPVDSKFLNLNKRSELTTLTLDVFPAVSRWRASEKSNKGLIIQLFDESGNELSWSWDSTDYQNLPTLFTYSDDGIHKRVTRDAKTLSRQYRAAVKERKNRNKQHRSKNRKRNLCARHKMFVDFTDVGWNDWIVAPPGYHAYHCAGECPFPMAEHLNATNHAVIQALVNSMNPQQVPPPCCVPTKYSSLSLLYTDSSDKIVLKNYNEMVVDSCGCS